MHAVYPICATSGAHHQEGLVMTSLHLLPALLLNRLSLWRWDYHERDKALKRLSIKSIRDCRAGVR